MENTSFFEGICRVVKKGEYEDSSDGFEDTGEEFNDSSARTVPGRERREKGKKGLTESG